MPSDKDKPPLVVLLGPTAVGKSSVALELATRFNGEIVSADSRLFYRGMDIGTAKPNLEERSQVPHHLIDVAEVHEAWSLAQFQTAAESSIADIHERGKLPFLVGGSGQYVRAITEGWLPPKLPMQPNLRVAIENWGKEIGVQNLHNKLALIDPIAASRMDARNLRRIVRALEVIFSSGKLFSKQSKRKKSNYRLIQIGLNRERSLLYDRIDQRINKMVEDGWLEEVRDLIKQGIEIEMPGMTAIGYPQLVAHINGEMELEEALRIIKRKSRQFVRHQGNWFKADDPEIAWFEAGQKGLIDVIERSIRGELENLKIQ